MVKEKCFYRSSNGRVSIKQRSILFILTLVMPLVLCGNVIYGVEQGGNSGTGRHNVFSLINISADQGKRYLDQLRIGAVSRLPGTNALLVTGQPYELNKASTVLKIVDSKEQYVIREILPAEAAKNLPSNSRIAEAVGGISIGDFSNPPVSSASVRAIIDIHKGMVLAVAPANKMEQLVSAIEQLQKGSNKLTQGVLPKTQAANLQLPRANSNLMMGPSMIENTQPSSLLPIVREVNFQEFDKPANEQSASTESSQINVQTESLNKPESSPEVALPATSDSSSLMDSASANKPYEPEPVTNGEEVINLQLPDKVDIVHLLGLAGQYLQLDFMYDPTKVKGDVTLMIGGKLRGPFKVKDLYPLLESVLKFKGFVMTRHKSNLVTIVPIEEALNIDPALIRTDKDKIKQGDLVITRPFKLEHIDTTSAYNLLTNMKLGVSISPIAETKTLLVTEFAYRMPRVEAILEMVDKPGEPKRFRFRQLKYTMAKTLAPKLQTLAEQLGTVSITIAVEQVVEQAPTIARLPNESDASYQRRLQAVRQAVAARPRTTPTIQPEKAGPTVYLDADERTNRILIIGLQDQLDLVEGLIDTLDVEQQDLRTMKLYKIKYVEAADIKKKLEELNIIAPTTRTTSSRISTQPAETKPPVVKPPEFIPSMETGAVSAESLVEEPQVVVIEASNSVLVNATAEQHARIESIIQYVDSEMDREKIPYQLYQLKNQEPTHMADVLQKLIQDTVLNKEGKVEKIIPKQEEQIIIVPDANTFSLIVYASKKNQEWLANLIEKLDKRRPQVLIDVTLVEISKTDAFNYDLNLLSSIPDLTDTSGLTSAIMKVTDANSSNLVSNLTNSSRDRFIDFQSNSGAGTGFYGDKHINALLTAMQQKNYGRILAKPKILVNDNMEGTISTTDTTYVTKTSSIPVTTGTAGQQTSLIQTATEFQSFDAGITLTITPHIGEGNLLRLDINLVRSDFGAITGSKPPDTIKSEIDTKATVPNGSTIILGGLLKLNQSKGGTKVPLLGDIPLVGGLFRGASDSDIQKKLYVFVKAEVIRPEDAVYTKGDLEQISNRNRTAFEQHEQEFQKYENWPGIKPKPVDPLKVLEAE
jgi:type II secretory pathway component GspD/PulD (secretin)